jgi:hypothetical protein
VNGVNLVNVYQESLLINSKSIFQFIFSCFGFVLLVFAKRTGHSSFHLVAFSTIPPNLHMHVTLLPFSSCIKFHLFSNLLF